MDQIPDSVVGLLVFLSSSVILFVEMIEPKLFQFLKVFGHEVGVVAIAMLGLGVAGLVSFLIGRMDRRAVALSALLLGPSVALSFFITIKIPHPVPAALFCSLPYFLAGLIIGLAYIHFSSWRVYGLSLLGSGLGIALVYVCLPGLGAEGSMLLAAAVAGAAGVIGVFYAGYRRLTSGFLVLGLLAFLVCSALFVAHLFSGCFDIIKLAPRHPKASSLEEPGQLATEALRLPGSRSLASGWSAISRVDALFTPSLSMERLTYPEGVSGIENPLVRAELEESFGSRIHLYANNVWFSSLPEKVPLDSWLIPYTLLDRPRVLVIGVGGGIDLARALAREPRRLVGVEINPLLVEFFSGPLAKESHHVYDQAEILVMDGRSYVHFTGEKFDLINLVFADLYIPFHFSNIFMENYLYTVEAFEDYLGILSDDGYLCVTKMVGSLRSPTELLRITATAMEAARRSNIPQPEKNIVVVGFSSGREDVFGGTMIFKKSVFNMEELAEIRSELSPPLYGLYLPGESGFDNPFSELITSPDPAVFFDKYPLEVSPPTDDKPFFYLFDKSHKLHKDVIISFLALTTIVFWIPFVIVMGRKKRYKEPAYGLTTVYVVILALGYIFVETSLVQKLNLYLGGPLYSLSVVTAAFLIYPGLTGILAGRVAMARSPIALILVPISLLLYEPVLIRLVSILPPLTMPLRVVFVFGLLSLLCLPLGLPFPFALDAIKSRAGNPAAGLIYGVSCIASVTMVTLSLYLSARFGIQALYLSGAGAYFVVFVLAFPLSKLSVAKTP